MGINWIFICGGIIIIVILIMVLWDREYESPRVTAGKEGEKEAARIIKQVLKEDDILLANICINHEGKSTELDNVIINSRGVFIIEVKNYSGTLIGQEEDYEWTKYKVSRGGNVYEKQVRNPIKQVKRQVYILSRLLKYYGINVWIDGYVLILNSDSHIHSDVVLESFEEIDWAIHRQSRNSLNKRAVIAIAEIFM